MRINLSDIYKNYTEIIWYIPTSNLILISYRIYGVSTSYKSKTEPYKPNTQSYQFPSKSILSTMGRFVKTKYIIFQ